jgi:tRNA C32,U32 (ribose-2'-O)-methylase TrmJ
MIKNSLVTHQGNKEIISEELDANYILTIPTMNGYSLNLSHCISIVAYELSKMFKVSIKDKSHMVLKPSSSDIEKFVNFLMKLLNKQGFTTIFTKKLNLEISIRNFLKTSNISQKSLKTAYGILKFITK